MENKIKIIALFGKAGAGKDTILNELFNTYGSTLPINKIISCTTRPPRDYEVDGKDLVFNKPKYGGRYMVTCPKCNSDILFYTKGSEK